MTDVKRPLDQKMEAKVPLVEAKAEEEPEEALNDEEEDAE